MHSLSSSPAASGSAATLDFHNQVGLQLTAVLNRLRAANKMRVPGESSVRAVDGETVARPGEVSSVVPSLAPAPHNNTADNSTGAHAARRYSRPQHDEEESDDLFDPNRLLNRFSSSMALYSRHRKPNMYEKSGKTSASSGDVATAGLTCVEEWSSLGHAPSITKCLSTSDITKMSPSSPVHASDISARTGDSSNNSSDSSNNSSLVNHYLNRRGSTGAVLARVSPQALETLREKALAVKDEKNMALTPAQPATRDLAAEKPNSDKSSTGFGLLSRTRQFGAWLTKTTEGAEMEVSKTDLNVVAPSSF